MRGDRIAADRDGNVPGFLHGTSLVVALALLVVFASFAGSAAAAVTGLQRVHADSASSSAGFRAVTATCPAGKRVLGGGAELFGGESQVSLNDVIPNRALTSVTAEAFEDQTGHAGSLVPARLRDLRQPLRRRCPAVPPLALSELLRRREDRLGAAGALLEQPVGITEQGN